MDDKILFQDLSNGVSARSGLSKKDSDSFVREFFQTVEQFLQQDRIVKVKGLGTFKIVEVSGRDSVNVNTGERIHIEGHSKVTFTPDSTIRDYVNRPFSEFETIILNEGVDLSAMEYIDTADDNDDDKDDDIEEVAVEESAVVDGSVDESVVEESTVDESAVEEPTVDESVEEEPTVEEPAVDESVVEEPTVEGLAVDESVVEEPIVEEPAVDESVVENPKEEESIGETSTEEDAADETSSGETVTDEESTDETAVEEEAVEEKTSEEELVMAAVSEGAPQKGVSTNDTCRLFKKMLSAIFLLLVAGVSYYAGSHHWLCSSCELAAEKSSEKVENTKKSPSAETSTVANKTEKTPSSSLAEAGNDSVVNNSKLETTPGNTEKSETTVVGNTNQKTEVSKEKPKSAAREVSVVRPKVNEGGNDTSVQKSVQTTGKSNSANTVSSDSASSVAATKYPQVRGAKYQIVGIRGTHVVESGEGLFSIARKEFGSMEYTEYIMKLNHISNPDHIEVGQVLKMPELEKK